MGWLLHIRYSRIIPPQVPRLFLVMHILSMRVIGAMYFSGDTHIYIYTSRISIDISSVGTHFAIPTNTKVENFRTFSGGERSLKLLIYYS